jgi:serine protease AprX
MFPKWISCLTLSLGFSLASQAALPSQPTEASHPGSSSYQYTLKRESFQIKGRQVDVFLPAEAEARGEKVPVIVFGHGQAIDVRGYEMSFTHLARKGVAVIHPMYDSGFFDQDWRRMADDFNDLTQQTLRKYEPVMDHQTVVYSGHSKGAYIALMAAGAPSAKSVLPGSVVVFAPAGFDEPYLRSMDPEIPLTLVWSDADTIIKQSAVNQIYSKSPAKYKQFLTVRSYPELKADHFFPLTKASAFGGRDGVSAYHYQGTWKWLLGAVWDLKNGNKKSNSYLYGADALDSGISTLRHSVTRSWERPTAGPMSLDVLNEIRDQGSADVIVILKSQADVSSAERILDRTQRLQFVYDTLRETAVSSQGSLLLSLRNEGLKVRSFHLINAVAVSGVQASNLRRITAHQEISRIVSDSKSSLQFPIQRKIRVDEMKGSNTIQDNLISIGADRVWARGFEGQGIVIAGQDSGFRWDHPALRAQYRGTRAFGVQHDYNWHDAIREPLNKNPQGPRCPLDSPAPCDDSGHGTHTMGTMLGFEDREGVNRIGVAPKAQWIGCRNMDQGTGRPSTYLECFEFFLAPYPRGGNPKTDGRPELAPHIINNSWGCPLREGCQGPEFLQIIQNLQSAGIAVIAAAGNEGPDCESVSKAPAFYSGHLITAAAYDHRRKEMADFSSRGPSPWNGGLGPNLTAPGNYIRSSIHRGGVDDRGLYDYRSGTSMASPHIAGAIALLWSARPELLGNVQATTRLLEKTAQPITTSQKCGPFLGNQIPNAIAGYGLVDVWTALETRH